MTDAERINVVDYLRGMESRLMGEIIELKNRVTQLEVDHDIQEGAKKERGRLARLLFNGVLAVAALFGVEQVVERWIN